MRNKNIAGLDIHDRVNYAVERSFLRVDPESKQVLLEIDIDPHISPVMDYFEIFLSRMMMCRRAAEFLGCTYGLVINDKKLV